LVKFRKGLAYFDTHLRNCCALYNFDTFMASEEKDREALASEFMLYEKHTTNDENEITTNISERLEYIRSRVSSSMNIEVNNTENDEALIFRSNRNADSNQDLTITDMDNETDTIHEAINAFSEDDLTEQSDQDMETVPSSQNMLTTTQVTPVAVVPPSVTIPIPQLTQPTRSTQQNPRAQAKQQQKKESSRKKKT